MNKNEILEKQLKDLTTHLQQVLKPAHQFDLHTNNIKNILESTFQQFELNKTWHHLQDTLDKVNKWNALMLSTLKLDNDYFLKLREAIISLSKFGWYINYSTVPKDIFKAFQLITSNDEVSLNDFMCKIIELDYVQLKNNILQDHGHRTEPLGAAFRAHEMQEYFLSVPVFLTQIDGITHDALNKHFFIKPEKIKKWAREKEEESMSKIMFAALNEITIFQAESVPHNRGSISRHSILHGGNVSYGTRINSYKVLSLLSYLTDIISIGKRNS